MLATVLAAPLLVVEIAPGADATPDAALAAFHADLTDADEAADPAIDGPARAVGALSAADLAGGRLLSPLSVGDELRTQAEAEAAEAAAAAKREADAEAARQETARQEAARQATTTTTTAPPPAPPPAPPEPVVDVETPAGGPTAAQWAALRQCEAGGNYAAISRSGRYHGAYQFLPSTWNGVASSVGRTDLVGLLPSQAAPADQDLMAAVLYARSGSAPWPHCGVHLP